MREHGRKQRPWWRCGAAEIAPTRVLLPFLLLVKKHPGVFIKTLQICQMLSRTTTSGPVSGHPEDPARCSLSSVLARVMEIPEITVSSFSCNSAENGCNLAIAAVAFMSSSASFTTADMSIPTSSSAHPAFAPRLHVDGTPDVVPSQRAS